MPDQVSMDMTRNEVQIDLDKFMAMSAEVFFSTSRQSCTGIQQYSVATAIRIILTIL